jgi:hypothetical protein
MAGNAQVLGLLEEMLDSGKTPEEVCSSCPDLLPQVRQRWQEFCLIDEHVRTLLPGLGTNQGGDAITSAAASGELPHVPGYEVEAVLGRGGMGVVYKARHLALKRTVALKMLAAGHHYQGERARFRAEAEAVARLQHPNIVQIHEIGEAAGRPFFALEYVAGGSLAGRMAGKPVPPREAARLVQTLAEAMHLAHSRNLIHRDLKPANVLLAGEVNAPLAQCQPKVTDFGLVRQLDVDSGNTLDGVVMGTPSYMAPEQAAGQARAVGPAVDVYALGGILYECLTGRPPFDGATAQETLDLVRGREPAPPSSLNRQVPRDLETICLKCLRKEPERRYASAQELADDLGRFLHGEPVQARRVGRLEKLAKWTRRNPAVACLAAVAVLAFIGGTVVSLRFGALASRKADELQEKALELQAQTRQAQDNARHAEESQKEVARVLVSGLLIPIGRNPHLLNDPLNATEAEALRQLRAAPVPIRLQFLESGLRGRDSARRLGRRADWVIQAIVGCDRATRADVAQLVVQRIQDPAAPAEVRFACARLGLALHLTDRSWAERSAEALLKELRDPLLDRDDYTPLAEALADVCSSLPSNHGADYAARALEVFLTRLQHPVGRALANTQLGNAIVAISPALEAAAAGHAAEVLGARIHKGDAQYFWPPVAKALAAVCLRLDSAEAAAHINGAVDFIIDEHDATAETKKLFYSHQAQALRPLCGRLDPGRAGRVAAAIVAILGDRRAIGTTQFEFIADGSIAAVLTLVAERLDAAAAQQSAEILILALRKAENIVLSRDELRTALVTLCRPLDAAGAAHVADAIAAGARDPKTSALALALLADGYAAVAGRLTPDQAAAVESALVDAILADLADPKLLQLAGFIAPALATTCGRPGATAAARAADGLVTAIRDPQTPLTALKPLATALAVVSGRLSPREATAHAKKATEVLDSLWIAKSAPQERACLAEALAAVWSHLDPKDTAGRARKVTADLENALGDSRAEPSEVYRLVEALAAVYHHLDPAERSVRASAVADAAIAMLRKPKNDFWPTAKLSEALAALCVHLDQPGVVRAADALLGAYHDANTQQVSFALYEPAFKKMAARLDERHLQRLLDHPLVAGRLQRVLLDVLGGSKNRTFRNTWDYLDPSTGPRNH